MEGLQTLRQDTGAARCLSCGKCTTMCPLAASGGFSARLIAAQDLEEEIQGRGVGVGRCLTCASCEVRCPQGVRFTSYVRALRELLPPASRRPCPHGAFLMWSERLMAGGARPAGVAWLEEGLEVSEECEIAVFAGCLPLFDAYFGPSLGVETAAIARATVRLLNHLGIAPVVVAEAVCCGHDALWRGDREVFQSLARRNAELLADRGVREVVTPCAECALTIREGWPAAVPGPVPAARHVAELLADALADGRLVFAGDGEEEQTVTYQDPCRLARHLGVVEAPRRVLRSQPGTRLADMRRTGRDAVCCGTAGFLHCDAESRRLQGERLAEATATGADTLITACPKCLIHFRCAQAEDRRRGRASTHLRVEDFTLRAAERLGAAPKEPAELPAAAGRRT